MKISALYNIKGGVGKTATSINLSYIATQENFHTLLIDLDPQGSASYYFRVRPSKKIKSKTILKSSKNIDKNIKGTDYINLDSLPADLSYRKMDIILNQLKKSKQRFKKILYPLDKEYDLIFIDCPPNITLLSENIFNAADFLLVPVIPTTLSIITYEKLQQFFRNRKLKRSKIVPFFSMVEKRKRMHREIMDKMLSNDKRFLKNCIPYLADIEKMGIYREPVPSYLPKSISAQSYYLLWEEIKQKCKLNS